MSKTIKLLKKQPPMRKVLIALIPCIISSIYYFGWRSLAVVAVACVTGFITEYCFCRHRKEPVTEAVFVTSTIFALVMPPTIPWHVVIIGVLFAVFFGKEVFGGFGRNIFNPAVAGRAFVYICFPIALTGVWSAPAQGPMGAITKWTTMEYEDDGTVATTGPTTMAHVKSGAIVPTNADDATVEVPVIIPEKTTVNLKTSSLINSLLFGRIPGTMGVTSAILILIGGFYLYWTKTANRVTILSLVISYAAINWILTIAGIPKFYGAAAPVFGGGFLFGAFFMATDPVSSPKTDPGRIFYGIIIALGTVVIRNFSIFNGGLMFSILLGNMFGPIIDYAVKDYQQKKKLKAAPAGGAS